MVVLGGHPIPFSEAAAQVCAELGTLVPQKAEYIATDMLRAPPCWEGKLETWWPFPVGQEMCAVLLLWPDLPWTAAQSKE